MTHHLPPKRNSKFSLAVTPASAGWKFLSFTAATLQPGEMHTHLTENTEVAIVPLRGEGHIIVGDQSFDLKRNSVFDGKPYVLYVPPQHAIKIEAKGAFEFALGGAPAEGKYPVRLFAPSEMKSEMRGGGKTR